MNNDTDLPTQIPTIAFTALHPLVLLLSFLYMQFYKKRRGREGRVALRGEDEVLHSDRRRQQNGEPEEGSGNPDATGNSIQRHGAREVDVEELWG